MDKPHFRTFETTTFEPAEGLKEILIQSFLALILFFEVNSIETSQTAINMARKLRNQQEVSCCALRSEYRKMALTLHPDKGGTHEDMVHLNDARDSRTECSNGTRGCPSDTSKKSSTPNKKKTSKKADEKAGKKAGKKKTSKKKTSEKADKKKTSKKKASEKADKKKTSKKKTGKKTGKKKTDKTNDKSENINTYCALALGVGIVIKKCGEGTKETKPHVRTHPTSPRHR